MCMQCEVCKHSRSTERFETECGARALCRGALREHSAAGGAARLRYGPLSFKAAHHTRRSIWLSTVLQSVFQIEARLSKSKQSNAKAKAKTKQSNTQKRVPWCPSTYFSERRTIDIFNIGFMKSSCVVICAVSILYVMYHLAPSYAHWPSATAQYLPLFAIGPQLSFALSANSHSVPAARQYSLLLLIGPQMPPLFPTTTNYPFY